MTAVETVNIASSLRTWATRRPDRPAVICQRVSAGAAAYLQMSFAELEHESDCYARGLERIGITRGVRTVLMVKPSREFFVLTFAMFKVGAVIVLVDPGMGRKNLGYCLAEAEPAAFVGIPIAHLGRKLMRWAQPTLRIHVTVGLRWLWGGHRLSELRDESSEPYEMASTTTDETAAILFTSGSTGVPKGAVYTHGIFAAQLAWLHDEFGLGQRDDEVDIATFPLFALFDAGLGVTAVIPDMNASKPAQAMPPNLTGAVRDCNATQMFGSPALIDRLGRFCERYNVKLPTLRRIITAGAPVRIDILERLTALLEPTAEIHTPYGATEALPVASITARAILDETRHETAKGAGICVGKPVPGVDVFIIRITDDPIEQWSDDLLLLTGEIGEIVVKGPIVTREYYNRPEATKLAKIIAPSPQPSPASRRGSNSLEPHPLPPMGREGQGEGVVLHRMGDVGYFDKQGRLWFCGRKSQRVVTENGTLFTIPCEAIFNEHSDVFRTALVGVGSRGAQTPVLCVEERDWIEQMRDFRAGRRSRSSDELDVPDWNKTQRELLDLAATSALTTEIRTVLRHPRFPLDVRHNAKINRERLAVWAEKQLRR